VFSDLARQAHIWSDGALVVRPPPRDLFVQVLGGSTVCVLPIYLFVAEKDRTNRGINGNCRLRLVKSFSGPPDPGSR
jgi:hypothetical protein